MTSVADLCFARINYNLNLIEMKSKLLVILTVVILFLIPNANFGQTAPNLGTSSSFALFTADGAFASTGASNVTGDVGTKVGAFSGFGTPVGSPGTLIGSIHVADATSVQAGTDVLAAYADLFGRVSGGVKAVELAGQTFTHGVWNTGAASTLTGELILDAEGDPTAVFIIKIGGTLDVAGASNVKLINLASPSNVYWQIGGAFSLADGSFFRGTAIVDGAINLYGTSSLIGRGLSRAGAINVAANTVTLGAPPVVTSTQTDILCFGASTGAIDITATGGTSPYTYAWTGTGVAAATEDQTGLAAGSYSVIVTDANGFVSTSYPFTITQPAAALSATITAKTNVLCVGSSTGSATVTATGGTGDYTYSWNTSPVKTTATATGLIAGTYTVTVTDANLCTTTASAIITQPAAALSATITAQTNVLCVGSSTGSATVTASGGTGDYTYSWNTSPVKTTATATGLIAGTYTVTVTDENLCTTTASAIITQPAVALSASITAQTNVLCVGSSTGSATVTASGGTGVYTYSWNTSPVKTTATATGLIAGTYTVTVTDENLCTTTATAIITQPAVALSASITAQTNVLCFGSSTGSATVTASGGTGVYTYSWNTSPVQTTATATGLIAGTYTVTVTDANLCTITATAIITQPVAALAAPTATLIQPTCIVATGTITITAPTGTGITYSIGGAYQSSATFSAIAPGIYTVTAKNDDGCISTGTIITINAQPATPAAPIATLTQPTCTVSTGTITVTAPTGTGMTYSIGGAYQASATFSSVVPGTYTVTAKNADGCISTGTSVTINAQPATPAAPIATLIQPTCTVATGTITVTAPTGTGITYSIGGAYQASATFSAVAPGIYTVTAKSAAGCVSAPSTVTIVVIDCSADLSIINTVDNIYPLVGRTVVFTVVATNNGPNNATGVTVNDMLPAGYTYVSSTTTRGTYVPSTGVWTIGALNNGASETFTVTAKVNPTGNYLSTATITGIELDRNLVNNVSTAITYPTEFFIPDGFSPNGDGINDLFVIRGINYFPDNEFIIFNRWGNKVFEASSYQNTWDGRSTRGLRVGGDELPIGTYFYLLDLGDGSDIIKGTIYLNR